MRVRSWRRRFPCLKVFLANVCNYIAGFASSSTFGVIRKHFSILVSTWDDSPQARGQESRWTRIWRANACAQPRFIPRAALELWACVLFGPMFCLGLCPVGAYVLLGVYWKLREVYLWNYVRSTCEITWGLLVWFTWTRGCQPDVYYETQSGSPKGLVENPNGSAIVTQVLAAENFQSSQLRSSQYLFFNVPFIQAITRK